MIISAGCFSVLGKNAANKSLFAERDQQNKFLFSKGTPANNLSLTGNILRPADFYFRSRTNVHFLVFHLTIADSIVCFITLPLEAAWRYTMQWRADNITCKVMMVVRALGYYLSSAILVNLCIDRCVYYHYHCQAQPKHNLQLSWALLSELRGTYTIHYTPTLHPPGIVVLTCSSLIFALFITCSWLVCELFMTCLWLVHDLPKTCSLLVYDLFKTWS